VNIRNRFSHLLGAGAALCLVAAPLHGATLYWQGTNVSGNLMGPNYTDGVTNNLTPTASDVVHVGGGGTASYSTPGTVSLQKLRVGHNTAAPGNPGTGIVNLSNGAKIDLTVGGAGGANAALWVGNVQNGTLNIDGAGTSVTSARFIAIGYGNNTARMGTVNITNGGSLIATLGNINLGESNNAMNGVQGHVNVDGTVSAMSAGADLVVGVYGAKSTFTQTGGLVSVDDSIEVGASTSLIANVGSSYSISGGTTTHAGNFFLGRGASVNATANISGTAIINTGNRYLMGAGTATGIVTNHSGGTLNTTFDVRVGDSGSGDTTYNLSGTGVINSTTGGIVGRQGAAKFLQTGGVANFNGTLSIGNRETATGANSGLYKISAGDLNIATALNVANSGTGEFRVVGDDATIDVTGAMLVGNTANGLGTLAFELETGDLLSQMAVTGTATFSTGAALVFDATNAAPTQNVYNLLTAASIVDGGIAFTAPVGWSYQIVSGGNGQILQAVLAVPEPNTIGLALLAGLTMVRRRR
jgi:hypothetical protein